MEDQPTILVQEVNYCLQGRLSVGGSWAIVQHHQTSRLQIFGDKSAAEKQMNIIQKERPSLELRVVECKVHCVRTTEEARADA